MKIIFKTHFGLSFSIHQLIQCVELLEKIKLKKEVTGKLMTAEVRRPIIVERKDK